MKHAPTVIGAVALALGVLALWYTTSLDAVVREPSERSAPPTRSAPAMRSAPSTPSPSGGAYDWSRVDQAIEWMVADHELAGASMIVLRGSDRIYERAVGSYTLHTAVTVGSASKWASAAAFLALVDDGALKLDEPLARHVASFGGQDKRAITLRHALSHRAGFLAKHPCLRDYEQSLQWCVDQFAEVPLIFEPGTSFGYGALSYHAAAAAAEVATGKGWREIFQAKVADPLGMSVTRYGRQGRSPNPGVAGNLTSSAEDFARFLEMILNDGEFRGRRVLSPERVREMESPHAGGGDRVHHVPDRHVSSKHDIYGFGVWRDLVGPDGELLVASAPGKFGFTPWVDRRIGVAGVLVSEFTSEQLEQGKPPDPADVIYLVCDIVDRAENGSTQSPNPRCVRKGVDEGWRREGNLE